MYEPDNSSISQNQERNRQQHAPIYTYDDNGREESRFYKLCSYTLILFSIIALIISLSANNGIKSFDGVIMDFKYNWNLLPITDIKTTHHEWPSGYENLINSEWPGTNEGWECTHSHKYYSVGLNPGICSKNQTIDGCRKIQEVKSIPINKFYSYRIWGKRSGDSFANMLRPIRKIGGSKIEWGYGYKLWGAGGRDYSVWVRDSQECPLNHIDIKTLGDLSQIPAGYKAQPLDGGQYVLFTNKSDRLPIVKLKITEGDICANPKNNYNTKDRFHYKLLKNQSKEGWTSKISGSYFDPRYKIISRIREDRL